MTEERLIAIETREVDKSLGPNEMRLIFSTGRQEITDVVKDAEKFKGRMFLLGDMKKDVQ